MKRDDRFFFIGMVCLILAAIFHIGNSLRKDIKKSNSDTPKGRIDTVHRISSRPGVDSTIYIYRMDNCN